MKRAKLNNNKSIALYCRLSKDDGTNNESMSIGTQKTMLKEYAKRNGFLNCQFYTESIIEQNHRNNVQKILQSRPPVIGESSSGYNNIFRGIIKYKFIGALETLE